MFDVRGSVQLRKDPETRKNLSRYVSKLLPFRSTGPRSLGEESDPWETGLVDSGTGVELRGQNPPHEKE